MLGCVARAWGRELERLSPADLQVAVSTDLLEVLTVVGLRFEDWIRGRTGLVACQAFQFEILLRYSMG